MRLKETPFAFIGDNIERSFKAKSRYQILDLWYNPRTRDAKASIYMVVPSIIEGAMIKKNLSFSSRLMLHASCD